MTQITIEVPDELAQRLEPFQHQLSELLTRLIVSNLPDSNLPDSNIAGRPALYAHAAELPAIYTELIDFLVSRPTAQQILEFKVSEQSQNRLQTLLQKNREAVLNSAETAELDLYEQLDNMMSLLKVRVYADRNLSLANSIADCKR
jgi:hypothetical protein